MPRGKRAKSVEAPSEASTRPTFQLGNRTFEIFSTFERNSEESYDEACEFDAVIMPLVIKLYGILSASKDYSFSSDIDIMAFMSDMRIAETIRDMGQDIPKLVLFVAHGSEPKMTLGDIKRLAGGPRNPQFYRAIFFQLQADGLFSKFGELSEKFAALAGLKDPAALIEALKKVAGNNEPAITTV